MRIWELVQNYDVGYVEEKQVYTLLPIIRHVQILEVPEYYIGLLGL